jgi:hypothetical protein
MKRVIIIVLLICGIYFTKSMLVANEKTVDNSIKVEQISEYPQVKDCCKNTKVGEKCDKCGKIKQAKEDCCKNTKIGEKCDKCGKIKQDCCKNTKIGEKCAKCGKVKKACAPDCKKE